MVATELTRQHQAQSASLKREAREQGWLGSLCDSARYWLGGSTESPYAISRWWSHAVSSDTSSQSIGDRLKEEKKQLQNLKKSAAVNDRAGFEKTYQELTGEKYKPQSPAKLKTEALVKQYAQSQEGAVDGLATFSAMTLAMAATRGRMPPRMTGHMAFNLMGKDAMATGAIKTVLKATDGKYADFKYDFASGAVLGALAVPSEVAGTLVSRRLAAMTGLPLVKGNIVTEHISSVGAGRAVRYLSAHAKYGVAGGVFGGAAPITTEAVNAVHEKRKFEFDTTARHSFHGLGTGMFIGTGLSYLASGRGLRKTASEHQTSPPAATSENLVTKAKDTVDDPYTIKWTAKEKLDDEVTILGAKRTLPHKKNDVGKSQWIGGRNYQEDTFVVSSDRQFAAVADGMGGYGGGDVASKIAEIELSKSYSRFARGGKDVGGLKWIDDAMRDAHMAIEKAQIDGFYKLPNGQMLKADPKMGSTVAATLREGDKMHIGWSGDSRIYRLRNGKLEQLTVDHQYPNGDLVGALGHHPNFDKITVEIQAGDRFLLASDGLETLSKEVIEKTLAQGLAAGETSTRLLEMVKAAGSKHQDNVTALVLDTFS